MELPGFFNKVYYVDEIKDNGWLSQFETAADICRAPSRWVATELWNGSKVYEMDLDFHEPRNESQTEGIRKVIRVVLGLILAIPGQLLAIPLMGIAFLSEEIRLKHKVMVVELSKEEADKLQELITQRVNLAKEKQGCEPISCLLVSICLLLCCLVCKK